MPLPEPYLGILKAFPKPTAEAPELLNNGALLAAPP